MAEILEKGVILLDLIRIVEKEFCLPETLVTFNSLKLSLSQVTISISTCLLNDCY